LLIAFVCLFNKPIANAQAVSNNTQNKQKDKQIDVRAFGMDTEGAW